MTDIKISELNPATQANVDDLLEASQVSGAGWVTKRVSLDQVTSLVAASEQVSDVIDEAIGALPPPVSDWASITGKPATFPPDPETVDDRVAALIVAGSNMTATYNDVANTLTLASTAAGGGGGTVTTTSVVSANGLAGTVATPTTTPAITLGTTISGILKGNATAISAAVAGTDYVTPGGLTTALGSYLPLTGGTLSGLLTGQDARFNAGFVSLFGAAQPGIDINATSNAANEKIWNLSQLSAAGGAFCIDAMPDSWAAPQARWTFARTGALTLPGTTVVGNPAGDRVGMETSGYVTLSGTAQPGIDLNATSNATNEKIWNLSQLSAAGGAFCIDAMADGFASTQARWQFNRTGALTLPGALTGTTAAFTGVVSTNGFTAGYLNVPQNIQASTYAPVLADSGKHIYHAVGAAAANWTIPANGTVAYPIGTTLTFVNDSANAISILITTDTLVWSPGTTTGSRTLGVGGIATALKVTATRWLISGTGLT